LHVAPVEALMCAVDGVVHLAGLAGEARGFQCDKKRAGSFLPALSFQRFKQL
jgi:hypothetical protein